MKSIIEQAFKTIDNSVINEKNFLAELGHAPLFLGIHAMISSIPHKTQMYIEMTLWYVNFIFTHFLFPQFNEIFLLDFEKL